ncbi:SIR2 family NAD-dependent protein deacylase [Acidisarcina polymorpha]|nr:NAD-dependent deacylase [Acidisarcina polymorpha]
MTPIQISTEDRVFVLTGAGISAESGLATFRDSDGLWSGHRVEDVATPEAWIADPELVWRFYSQRRRDARLAEPNPAHRALAALESAIGDRFFLCTQNVDDLHERAGSVRMIHMHGQLFESRCEDECGRPVFSDEKHYDSLATIGRCACGARIRPHIVWFGEVPLEMETIQREIERCTVLLVVGTSGVVYPAASFVHWANQRNRVGRQQVRTVYVGPEAPANAAAFTQVVLGKAGDVLPGLFEFS